MEIRHGNSGLFANQSSEATHLKPSQIKARTFGKKKEINLESERLKKACADFESIFINFMFQSMKKTLPGDRLFGSSHQKEIYESMFFQEISTKLAEERGMGIGEALFRQFDGHTGNK